MQGSARKDVVFGAARVYTVAVPGPKCKSWFNIVSLAMIGSLALCAQTNTGSIRVLVYDETMAVIQDVTVTALDESRGVTREAVTSDIGEFVFSHLAPGMYTLSFEALNFAPLTVEGFEVRVGEISTVSPQLAVAATEDRGRVSKPLTSTVRAVR